MLPRIIPVLRANAAATRLSAVQCVRAYGGDHKSALEIATENRATYNDLPVPEGSWQESHSKRQAKYNMYLIGSSLTFGVTMFAMYKAGCWYLHGAPDLKKIEIRD